MELSGLVLDLRLNTLSKKQVVYVRWYDDEKKEKKVENHLK